MCQYWNIHASFPVSPSRYNYTKEMTFYFLYQLTKNFTSIVAILLHVLDLVGTGNRDLEQGFDSRFGENT